MFVHGRGRAKAVEVRRIASRWKRCILVCCLSDWFFECEKLRGWSSNRLNMD